MYAYLLLAFFGFFDIYFSQFIFRGGEIRMLLLEFLGVSNVMSPPAILSNLGIVQIFPPLLALAGGVLSLYLLRKLRSQYPLHPLPYHLHQVIISMPGVSHHFLRPYG